MDGDIWVESEPGVGSEFIFTPWFGTDASVEAADYTVPGDIRGARVLLMEPNDVSRGLLDRALRFMSFEVDAIASAEEGLALLQSPPGGIPFQMALLGLGTVDAPGLDIARRICTSDSTVDRPKVAVIAAGDDEALERALEQDLIQAFCVKPVTGSMLFNTVMEAFGKAEFKAARPSGKREEDVDGLAGIRGARLLLVEDNEINQQVAMEILAGVGFVVDIAENGRQAVEKVCKGAYDAVLMDVQMPVMDGYTATKEIRKDERFATLPILAMTASAMVQDREQAEKAGMNGHISKPIIPKELVTELVRRIEPGERALPQDTDESSIDSAPPCEADDTLPEQAPGINIKAGLAIVGGNQKLYLKLLRKLRTNYVHTIREIVEARGAGDDETAARCSHTIKGVAGNLGATELAMAAGSVEQAIKQGQTKISDLLETMQEQLDRVFASIDAILPVSQAETATGAKLDDRTVTAAKKMLNGLTILVNDDLSIAIQKLDELNALLSGSVYTQDLLHVSDALNAFDVDGAINGIETLIQALGEAD
ncbi:response regulator [Thermodesulfobacteriota bacterium]